MMDSIYNALAAPLALRRHRPSIYDYEYNFEPSTYDYEHSWNLHTTTFQSHKQSYPSLTSLCFIVLSAVLQVVYMSLPGYIIARFGYFSADKQLFLSNLNVWLFTPCLIFGKLAAQLNPEKLADLAIIPVVFVIQTFVSWLIARIVSRLFGFTPRASNFVTAIAVFVNSNSLPISLVISLSASMQGLHWAKISNDTNEDVCARGILYLLIFQQLGQLGRWSWGYHVLLAPRDKYAEYRDHITEEGRRDSNNSQGYEDSSSTDSVGSESEKYSEKRPSYQEQPCNGASLDCDGSDVPYLLRSQIGSYADGPESQNKTGFFSKIGQSIRNKWTTLKNGSSMASDMIYYGSPRSVQGIFTFFKIVSIKLSNFLWKFMNPPLWAMLLAVFVASFPKLQSFLFTKGTFVESSLTTAINTNGDMAIPLMLVVLGANLAHDPSEADDTFDPEEEEVGGKILIASLLSRMFLPMVVLAPIFLLMAKYLPVSIIDDPVFVVVCFLLAGAPCAMQLAQICQINNVFAKSMGKVLFHSYVIWVLPTTLALVMMAMKTIEWSH